MPVKYQPASCTLAVFLLRLSITHRVLVSPACEFNFNRNRSFVLVCTWYPLTKHAFHVKIQARSTIPRFFFDTFNLTLLFCDLTLTGTISFITLRCPFFFFPLPATLLYHPAECDLPEPCHENSRLLQLGSSTCFDMLLHTALSSSFLHHASAVNLTRARCYECSSLLPYHAAIVY